MVVICQMLERLDQDRSRDTKLFQTLFDRPGQNPLAVFCQFHQDACAGARAPDKIIGLRSIDQFDGAVMAAPELVRQGADRRLKVFGEASYGEQELILSRFDSRRSGGLIAEIQVAADVESKFGQCPVV